MVETFNATDVAYGLAGVCLQASRSSDKRRGRRRRKPWCSRIGAGRYRELDERSNHLAHWLRALGVGRDTVVGVLPERSLEMVVALYGVLKAGGAYLPLDPEQPAERLAAILADSRRGAWC